MSQFPIKVKYIDGDHDIIRDASNFDTHIKSYIVNAEKEKVEVSALNDALACTQHDLQNCKLMMECYCEEIPNNCHGTVHYRCLERLKNKHVNAIAILRRKISAANTYVASMQEAANKLTAMHEKLIAEILRQEL